MRRITLLSTPLAGLGALALAFCPTAPTATVGVTAPPAEIDPLIRNVDPAVSPGEDFFRHANGTWLKNNPIPATERGWGVGQVVDEEIRHQLREICEEAARAGAPKGSIQQKVGDYWLAALDSAGAAARGIEPLGPLLAEVAAISTTGNLMSTVARLHTCGVRALYGIYIGQDDKNSEAYIVSFYQGGIGLPERDYYFLEDSTTARIRAEYPRHIAAMLRFTGYAPAEAEAAAARIVAIETSLAEASRTLEELRDPYANYNKLTAGQLAALTPAIDWTRDFAAMGIPAVDSVVVGQPEFLVRVNALVESVPLAHWKEYLTWWLASTFAANLHPEMDAEDFRFYATVLDGRQAQRPRWKRALEAEENAIGELLGQLWVERHCSPATKARYEKLVDDIVQAYAGRIRNLDWMSEPTRQRALAKLAKVQRKVGYPDRWRDYSALEIDHASWLDNEIRVHQWWFHHEASKLGRPVDHTEWDMTPQTYNAYYSSLNVEIVLPAAVFLIPGLPDSLMDDAILYAGAGAATIGHEITHGFDDEGRLYDERGNLRPWWTPEDSVRFAARAAGLVRQFDGYKVGGRQVRGQATLGENIADLGGLAIGYEAFQRTEQWRSGVLINGLTPDQRFFLGYALSWMGHYRPEFEDMIIMSDVHAPTALRVNGPLANLPAFHAAFGIKPGDPMYRDEESRVRIW